LGGLISFGGGTRGRNVELLFAGLPTAEQNATMLRYLAGHKVEAEP